MDLQLSWKPAKDAFGYNVRYGIAPDKLYSSWQIYDSCEVDIGTISVGNKYYIRVDSYNENGITEGDIIEIE